MELCPTLVFFVPLVAMLYSFPNSNKFQSHSRKCIFIRYPLGKRGCWIYDLNTYEFLMSQDNVFYETISPYITSPPIHSNSMLDSTSKTTQNTPLDPNILVPYDSNTHGSQPIIYPSNSYPRATTAMLDSTTTPVHQLGSPTYTDLPHYSDLPVTSTPTPHPTD